MNLAEEGQFLRAVLAILDNPRRTGWRTRVLDALAVAGIALVGYWVVEPLGPPDAVLILFLTLAFVSGGILGGLTLWRVLAVRAPLLQPYIDKERIRVRVDELDGP